MPIDVDEDGREIFLEAIYYHLSQRIVREYKFVNKGDYIGLTGNTGKYTTGPHLHFGIKRIYKNANWQVREVLDYNNGYFGAIDPQPYFEDGKVEFLPVDAYYERKREWVAEYNMRFKNMWLHRKLLKERNNRWLSNRETNALVYGGWGIDEVLNPAMYGTWAIQKKSEMLNNGKPYFRLTLG